MEGETGVPPARIVFCVECKAPLLYYNGGDDNREYFYCAACQDKAYDPDGVAIGLLT